VLVVDNAFYHNVTVAEDKEICDIKEGDMTQPELYEIIKLHKSKDPIYRLDRLLLDHGHTLLPCNYPLPPCILS
jgi:hypothetical protein